MQVDNLFLEKLLGKGAFGEVHLTRIKGDNNVYATKVYDRERIEQKEHCKNGEESDAMKYLKNEIYILHSLDHPNILKLKEVKKTRRHFYLVTDFCNGGELRQALDKYMEKYGKPFSEEIVQHFMRQIMSAFNYLHSKNIMHRDIKLENILLNYDSEQDKNDFNLMKAKAKVIDFGFASSSNMRITIVGSPLSMSPLMLKKLTSHGKIKQLGYDIKADIWSLGAICYEMLIGKAAFDADDMDELAEKIEEGTYKVPTSLSKEVISFLNGMLQYEPKARLNSAQLLNHPFLKEDVKNFHKIDLNQVPSKGDKNYIQINTKKKDNQTIWSIFNAEDEAKLINISPGQVANNISQNNIQQQKTFNPNNNSNPNIYFNQIKSYNTIGAPNTQNSFNDGGYSFNPNAGNNYYGPVFPRNNNGIAGNPITQNFNQPISYSFSPGGLYDN